jgi:hypothetical protein
MFRDWLENTTVRQDGRVRVLATGGWRKVAEFMAQHPTIFAPVTSKNGIYFVELPEEWVPEEPSAYGPPSFVYKSPEYDKKIFEKLFEYGLAYDVLYVGLYGGEKRILPFGTKFGKRGIQRPKILGQGMDSTAYMLKHGVNKRLNDDPFWKKRGIETRTDDEIEDFVQLSRNFPDIIARYWRDERSGRLMQEPVDTESVDSPSTDNILNFIDLLRKAEKSGLTNLSEYARKRLQKIESNLRAAPADEETLSLIDSELTSFTGIDAGPSHNVGYRKDGRMVFYDI